MVTKYETEEAARRLMAACIRAKSLLENWGQGKALTSTPAYDDLIWAIKYAQDVGLSPVARPGSIEV